MDPATVHQMIRIMFVCAACNFGGAVIQHIRGNYTMAKISAGMILFCMLVAVGLKHYGV